MPLRRLLNQPGGTYWNVFDEKGKDGFSITLAGYENLEARGVSPKRAVDDGESV